MGQRTRRIARLLKTSKHAVRSARTAKNKKAETSTGFGFSHKIYGLSLRSVGRFCLLDQLHEGCLIMNSQLRQLLAIHLDTD